MAANETALGYLHEKVAKVLTDLLDGTELPTGETNEETGEEITTVLPPSAAIITSAIQFLKNNNITCAPSDDNALGALRDKIADREKRRADRRAANAADYRSASEDARDSLNFMQGLPN